MTTEHTYPSTRAALADARKACTEAKRLGLATGTLSFHLSNGNTLLVMMQESAETKGRKGFGSYLLGAWTYHIEDWRGDSLTRRRSLAL